MASKYNYEFFNVTFPHEYVAVVEINRPEKLNAFKEMYVPFNMPSKFFQQARHFQRDTWILP